MKYDYKKSAGFSLIEVMIGLVIGLIATLVITNVFANFEKQKRTTMGTADAQTNGAIALYQIRRQIQNAGYGLPVFVQGVTPLKCYENNASIAAPIGSAEGVTVDHDGNSATPEIGISPVVIVDADGGNGGASDVIAVRYGDVSTSGAAMEILDSNNQSRPILKTALGCGSKNPAKPGAANFALIMNKVSGNDTAKVCEFVDVSARIDNAVQFEANPTGAFNTDSYIACLGAWNEHRYSINNNQLTVTGSRKTANGAVDASAIEIVPGVVDIQAQYGVSNSADTNEVVLWVDAVGNQWGPDMTVDNRNRIKAVRLAIVTRNGQRDSLALSQNCDGNTAGLAKVCIWKQDDTPASVDLTHLTDWQNYRYRVYETVIPIRNVMMNLPSMGDLL